jgi:hypothetical protein
MCFPNGMDLALQLLRRESMNMVLIADAFIFGACQLGLKPFDG